MLLPVVEGGRLAVEPRLVDEARAATAVELLTRLLDVHWIGEKIDGRERHGLRRNHHPLRSDGHPTSGNGLPAVGRRSGHPRRCGELYGRNAPAHIAHV